MFTYIPYILFRKFNILIKRIKFSCFKEFIFFSFPKAVEDMRCTKMSIGAFPDDCFVFCSHPYRFKATRRSKSSLVILCLVFPRRFIMQLYSSQKRTNQALVILTEYHIQSMSFIHFGIHFIGLVKRTMWRFYDTDIDGPRGSFNIFFLSVTLMQK